MFLVTNENMGLCLYLPSSAKKEKNNFNFTGTEFGNKKQGKNGSLFAKAFALSNWTWVNQNFFALVVDGVQSLIAKVPKLWK